MSKKLIYNLLFLILPISLKAQSKEHYVNNYEKAFAINSQYVKSFIGLDMDSLARLEEGSYKIEIIESTADSPLCFNGVSYKTLVNIVCNQYNPELITLSDIINTYAPDLHHTLCVFMINDIILTKDLNSFKIDKNYIYNIDVIYAREIEGITGSCMDINLIMIYTKTDDFLYKQKQLLFFPLKI